eukprot:TRINITY_DN4308_c0_g1_i3.p2 TRINITY_DN4308_c0_g1~~TRINITY_DN4308_c0_g1_i3.p2  ORF type:complete len:263 (-),score=39.86 TRINITY_DN4308_c0_g1_i3:1004-1693(-)
MSEEQQYKVWGKILIVARSLLRSVFHARKPEGNFLTSEFNLASLIGANQQELFNTVLAILKDNGLNWNARTKNNLESFLLTLVSISFIEVLLEEFDQIPQVTLTIRVSHATSRETESRTSENQRELTALKYPGWWEDSFAYLLCVVLFLSLTIQDKQQAFWHSGRKLSQQHHHQGKGCPPHFQASKKVSSQQQYKERSTCTPKNTIQTQSHQAQRGVGPKKGKAFSLCC